MRFNKRKIKGVVTSCLTLLFIASGGLFINYKISTWEPNTTETQQSSSLDDVIARALQSSSNATSAQAQDSDTKTLREIHGEVRGTWISTAYGIDFPKVTYNVDEQKKEIDTILDNVVNQGLNTVYFQVRPFADAFYNSKINPWSAYLTNELGKDPKWDPLDYIIFAGHKRGLEIHAWLNPFRVTTASKDLDSVLNKLPDGHIAKNKDLILRHWTNKDNKDSLAAYLNPEKEEVKQHLTDTVQEIAINYKNLDGIHMDDYFYPTYYPLPDGESPDGEVANKRRDAVTDIVFSISDTIKKLNPNLTFSISPAAVTKNSDMGTQAGLQNYYDLYADVEKWVKSNKVDVIIPQIYFDKNHKLVNFTTTANYWNNLVSGTDVDLVIGHMISQEESKKPILNELDDQIKDSRNLTHSIGSAFFGYSNLPYAKDKLDAMYK